MQDYTIEQLLDMLVEKMGNPFEAEVDNKELARVMKEWAAVDGSSELLHNIMGRDVLIHWSGKSDLERENVRGAFARTAWFRGMMRNADGLEDLLARKKKREA